MTGKWELPWEGKWNGHSSSMNYQRRDLCEEQATSRGCRRTPGEERELYGIIHVNSILSLNLQQCTNNTFSFAFKNSYYSFHFFQINGFFLNWQINIMFSAVFFFFPIKVTYLPIIKTPTTADNIFVASYWQHIMQSRKGSKRKSHTSISSFHSQGVTSNFECHYQELMRKENQESENMTN